VVQYVYTFGADLISQERNGKTYTYLYDGHGSVTALSDESGKITDTYSYDAFGNLLKSKGRTANNYRYCGEQFDSTTGLYYLRARYMDTSTGRFISQDSYAGSVYDPVSLHKYLYANSNPVMYTDPSGYTAATFVENVVVVAINAILEATYCFLSSAAFATGMKLIASITTIAVVSIYTYLITDYILDNINDVASGSKTSSDVNEDCKDTAVDGVPGKESDDEQDRENDDSDNDALGKLIGSTSPGRETKGRTKQREKNGDMDDANDDFNSLSPSNVKNIPGGRTGELDGDIKVNVRDHSSEGSPTIEIQYPNGTRVKIRYK